MPVLIESIGNLERRLTFSAAGRPVWNLKVTNACCEIARAARDGMVSVLVRCAAKVIEQRLR